MIARPDDLLLIVGVAGTVICSTVVALMAFGLTHGWFV